LPIDVFMILPWRTKRWRCADYIVPEIDWTAAIGGRISTTFLIWVLVGLFLAADWALVIVLNKRMLAYFNPLPLNLLLRFVTLGAILAITVPLTAFDWWDLEFGMSAEAAGYIVVAAVITWAFAFNAYYYALRTGRASVVSPITATDPIWAALFAPLVLGTSLDPLVLGGLLIATLGVVLIGRWMSTEGGELPEAAAIPAPAAAAAPTAGTDGAGSGVLRMVVLATIAAAGWGLGPVVIELAENANDGPSAGMMVMSQSLGAMLIGGIMLIRRGPMMAAPLGAERRQMIVLLFVAGLLEAVFAVLYYLIIAAIGAVLTLLLGATSPVFAILGGALFLGERVDRRLVAAATVTMGGVVIAILARAV
jgi:drug/metabolite transporter (DMT)-like permease